MALYLSGCASSNDDKYDLITKEDRKLIKDICQCVEPLSPYMEKIMNAKDSLEGAMYMDSLIIKSKDMTPCSGDSDALEMKAEKDEKYTKQMIAYIEHYYPKCLPFFLGVRSKNEIQK